VEGSTDAAAVNALREQQKRNFMTTLLLSQGVPMVLGGDELGRTQGGNNNAWCQDNEISWYDWELDGERERLLEFTRRLIALRKAHPVFRRPKFFTGESPPGMGLPDIWWFRPDGRKMTRRDWSRGDGFTVGVFLNGDEIWTRTPDGEPILDDSFVLLFNAYHEPLEFKLPVRRFGARWVAELATAGPEVAPGAFTFAARDSVPVESRSVVVLRRT
jgi:isoamylase